MGQQTINDQTADQQPRHCSHCYKLAHHIVIRYLLEINYSVANIGNIPTRNVHLCETVPLYFSTQH
jgi:hypothetical protein